ncbi:hypothetical protein [Leucobacter luti]|uniref:Uncharacterized protein n=1 Tax=Leucobacter luti TaxID=340320 RepID=A0A4Q7U062_9MICO|nr:hypothetical protein [Leucobacter luti]MBL3699225.1 hypothetical protein [Leucobacter luti]RZT66725.1 hypothetical protein EV139_0852 [Leucobacter luti]
MAYRTLISPNFEAKSAAGGCLIQAQKVVGAGGGPHSATSAANQTQYRHYDRNFPTDALAVVWFSHWGTYWNYIEQRYTYEDYGHVVVTTPDAFGIGQRGFYSSPSEGIGGEWFRTIEEVERAFNSVFRFWSEDLNGVRVCAPVSIPNIIVPAPPAPIILEDPMPERHSTKEYNGGQVCAPGKWTTLHINEKRHVTILHPGAKRRVGTTNAIIHTDGEFEARFVYDTVNTKTERVAKSSGSVIARYDRKGVHAWPVDLSAKGANTETRLRVQVRPVGAKPVKVSAIRTVTDYWEK